MNQEIKNYFEDINKKVSLAYDVASKARKKGLDPVDTVEIVLAKDMAERVEGLISVVAPQIKGSGMVEEIKNLEGKYGKLDWRVALVIGLEVAEQRFCEFKDKKEAIEVGIRTGFAYHTVGVVSAPLEGFVELTIKNTRDGKEYFSPKFEVL